MAVRITQLPEMSVLHDSDLMVIVNTGDSVTQRATVANVRAAFTTTAINVAVGTTSPIFQLALPDASGLSPFGGVRLTTGSLGSLVLKDGSNSDYSDLIAGNGIFTKRLGVSLLGTTAPLNFAAQIGGDLGPDVNSAFNIGSPGLAWLHVYADSASVGYLSASKADIGIFDITSLRLAPANAGAPSLAYTTDLTTGLFLVNPGMLGIASNGVMAVSISETGSVFQGPVTAYGASVIGRISATGELSSSNAFVSGNVNVTGQLTANAKSFLINHPTKPGMKLQYGSLEGPEHSVFVRGELVDTNIIFLPDYWRNLVDKNSITVQLTPIGKHQSLYVYSVSEKEIIVKNGSIWDNNVNAYYTVFAERIDIPKLKTEF